MDKSAIHKEHRMTSFLYLAIVLVLFLIGIFLPVRLSMWLKENALLAIVSLGAILIGTDLLITFVSNQKILGDLFGFMFNGILFYLAFLDKECPFRDSLYLKGFAIISIVFKFLAFIPLIS